MLEFLPAGRCPPPDDGQAEPSEKPDWPILNHPIPAILHVVHSIPQCGLVRRIRSRSRKDELNSNI